MAWSRLDIAAIEAAVRATSVVAGSADEPDLLRRLVEGYRYVDELVAARVDLFDYGQSRHLLELNHRVLCGVTPERRAQFAAHIAETERRFYDRPDAGIAEFRDWYLRHRSRPACGLAAGALVQVVSAPQLFIEGNRRTAGLIATYVLARAGLPPLVVTPATYARFRALLERASAIERRGLAASFSAALTARRVSDFIRETADARFLAPALGAPVRWT